MRIFKNGFKIVFVKVNSILIDLVFRTSIQTLHTFNIIYKLIKVLTFLHK